MENNASMKKAQQLAADGAKTTTERRSGADRRRLDTLPPGAHDRRRSVESRKPEVVEVEMTTTLWDAFGPEAADAIGGPKKT